MSIGSVSSISPILSQLQAQGLSKDKLKLVAEDVTAATAQSTGSAAAPITPAVRAAIDTKIAADVLSGKLSKTDAVAVKKTLDTVEGQDTAAAAATPDSTTPTAAAQTSGAKTGGGGGGGGGDSDKTELSETVIVAGSTKTTTITYTDNTASTTTTNATASDVARYGKAGTDTSDATKDYRPSIQPGLLIDQLA